MTAVEYLAEKYNYITWMRNRDEISAGTADEWRAKFLKEAKEMEEQQITKALSIADVMGSALFNSIGEWSKNAFPDAGSIEHIIKLKHEAQEVIEAPYDIKEYADCIIALLAAAYKADIAFFELVETVESKLEVNKKRKWKKLADGTYQHCP